MPPEARRTAIIGAVLPLLTERGATVTTRQLARAAGVSEGTLFKVFDDKDELVAAAVAAAIDPEPFERAVGAIDAALPFTDQLVAATVVIQRRIVDIWKLISQLAPHQHPDHQNAPLPDSAALTALFERRRTQLRQPPVHAARLLRALTLSLTHPLMTDQARTPDEIVDVFLHGVAR